MKVMRSVAGVPGPQRPAPTARQPRRLPGDVRTTSPHAAAGGQVAAGTYARTHTHTHKHTKHTLTHTYTQVQARDEASGRDYFYNPVTSETSWEKPSAPVGVCIPMPKP
jgi:hypothetical protein